MSISISLCLVLLYVQGNSSKKCWKARLIPVGCFAFLPVCQTLKWRTIWSMLLVLLNLAQSWALETSPDNATGVSNLVPVDVESRISNVAMELRFCLICREESLNVFSETGGLCCPGWQDMCDSCPGLLYRTGLVYNQALQWYCASLLPDKSWDKESRPDSNCARAISLVLLVLQLSWVIQEAVSEHACVYTLKSVACSMPESRIWWITPCAALAVTFLKYMYVKFFALDCQLCQVFETTLKLSLWYIELM